MDANAIARVVDDFWRSRAQGVPYPPIWFDRLSLEEAQLVQLGMLAREIETGSHHIGWKVGLTAPAIREQFGVHEPVFGYLLDRGLQQSGFVLQARDWTGPGFENELCMQLRSPLRGPGVDVVAARAAVEVCHPALELVENRGDLTAQLAVAIADNVQQRSFVIGTARPLPPSDLADIEATVRINGTVVGRGLGSSVMGSPLASIAWLANALAAHDIGLEPGQYVMTGSFTRQFPLRPGDSVETSFAGVGSVRVSCEA